MGDQLSVKIRLVQLTISGGMKKTPTDGSFTLSEQYAGESELKWFIDDGLEVTAKTVFDQAKQGDKFALMVVDKFYFHLGLDCGNIANILNPDAIVIGGGVSAAGEMLINGVEEYFLKFAFPQIRKSTKVKLAQLGNDAGVIGAASLVKVNKALI